MLVPRIRRPLAPADLKPDPVIVLRYPIATARGPIDTLTIRRPSRADLDAMESAVLAIRADRQSRVDEAAEQRAGLLALVASVNQVAPLDLDKIHNRDLKIVAAKMSKTMRAAINEWQEAV